MKEKYLLCDDFANQLYEKYAKELPIIDYHNHLDVQSLCENEKIQNITKLWISSDPYKHRAMRILGVAEKYITGDADDFEKFEKWYDSLAKLAGNVLYQWSEMELEMLFGIDLTRELDNSTPACEMWTRLNSVVQKMTPKDILDKFNIRYLSPCAAFCDDITAFDKLSDIYPSLRGDDGVDVSTDVVKKLEKLTSMSINTIDAYIGALEKRVASFKESGCRFSDHALDDGFVFFEDDGKNGERFENIINNNYVTENDRQRLQSFVLESLCYIYRKYGITLQLHIGALRKTSSRLRNVAGKAGGYAAIGNSICAESLCRMFDSVEKACGALPKTILFNLNPCDNALMDILCGSFSKDGEKSVVTRGPAWWWCDHPKGMTEMLDSFSNYSVLSTFVGMTTDSRSLLSLVRHDCFRRVLCTYISNKVKEHLLPDSEKILSSLIGAICFENAKELIEK